MLSNFFIKLLQMFISDWDNQQTQWLHRSIASLLVFRQIQSDFKIIDWSTPIFWYDTSHNYLEVWNCELNTLYSFMYQLFTDSIPPYVATTKNEVQATVLKLNFIMSLSNLLHYSDLSRISKNAAQLPSPWFKFQCWPRLV